MPPVRLSRNVSSKRQQVQRASHQTVAAKRFVSCAFVMSVCVLSLWGYFHASTLSGEISKTFASFMATLGFRLEDVVVEGRRRTDKNKILSLLQLTRGQPLLSLDLLEKKRKLEEISWVKAVQIERHLPNTLFIRISEKQPVSLWQNQGKLYLMDRDGEIVETKESGKYGDLLVVTGEKAPHYVGELIALLEKFSELKSRVTGATHLRSTRWDIRLDNRVDVKLPEKEAEQALSYLLDLTKNHQLMEQDIMTIDMRLPGKLILRLTPEAVKKKNNTGKDV